MADLARDTEMVAIPGEAGRYRGRLSAAWEIWGPMGGYTASLALRAAGAHTDLARPASLYCHYLVPGRFEEVEAEVTTVRRGRTTESMAVTLRQEGRAVLHATVLASDVVPGLEHHLVAPLDVPAPLDCPLLDDLLPDDAPAQFPFWSNYEERVIDWIDPWPPRTPMPARFRTWLRLEGGRFPDPWVDACRLVLPADVGGWPAAHRHHAWADPPFWAPNLDLYVAFHTTPVDDDWLLVDGTSPVAGDGLVAATTQVRTSDGRLVATGAAQLLCRPSAVAPPQPTTDLT